MTLIHIERLAGSTSNNDNTLESAGTTDHVGVVIKMCPVILHNINKYKQKKTKHFLQNQQTRIEN